MLVVKVAINALVCFVLVSMMINAFLSGVKGGKEGVIGVGEYAHNFPGRWP